MGKLLFCLVAMARLGKYCMGGYGVYRDKTLYNLGPFLGKIMDPS